MHARLETDAADYAAAANAAMRSILEFLPAADNLWDADTRRVAIEAVGQLSASLQQQREQDVNYVRTALPLLTERANEVPLEGAPADERFARERFKLMQISGAAAQMDADFIFGALLSSSSTADLKRVNPWLADAPALHDLMIATILHSSRVALINRCLTEAAGLRALLSNKFIDYERERFSTLSELELKAG